MIMLTASTGPSQVERAIQAGCNAHLTKPVTPARLFEALEKVLQPEAVTRREDGALGKQS